MAYTWTKLTSAAPWKARDGAGALVYNNAMYMIGGWNTGASVFPRSTCNEVWRSTDGANWTQLKTNSYLTSTFDGVADWAGRHTSGNVVHNGKMWIIGGDPLQQYNQRDVWSSTNGSTWVLENRGKPLPWIHRGLAGFAVFSGFVWALGGQAIPTQISANDEVYREVWRSADCINWTRVFTSGPIWDRRFLYDNVLNYAGKLWVIGGGIYDTPKYPVRTYYPDVWNSANGVVWTKISSNLLPARQYHNATVFNGRMFALAGWMPGNGNSVIHSADGVTWTALPTPPWAGRHAASVWVYNNALYLACGHLSNTEVWRLTP